MRKKSQRCLLN